MQVQEGADTLTPAHFIDDKNSQYELTNELITSIRTRQHGTRGDPTTRHTANTDPQLRTQDQRLARASDAPHAKPVAVHYQAKHILLGLVALLRRVVMGGERGTFGYVTLRARYVLL